MDRQARHALGIDLGGTAIKLCLCDRTGRVLSGTALPTEARHGPERALGACAAAVDDLLRAAGVDRDDLTGAGIGAPGPMLYSEGRLLDPGNLPGWKGFALRERLADRLGLAVAMDNDANLAALGEWWIGAGRGVRDMALFTLGTGVGGGVILDGELLRGHFANGAELGHMILVPDGRECACGQHGCLEAYSSATAAAAIATELAQAHATSMLRTVLDRKGTLSSEDLVRACLAGDEIAVQAWKTVCFHLGAACVNVQHVLNVELIVFGGGMSGAGPLLLDAVRESFDKLTWKLAQDRPRLTLAELGADAGMIGAARLAFDVLGGPPGG